MQREVHHTKTATAAAAAAASAADYSKQFHHAARLGSARLRFGSSARGKASEGCSR